MHMCYYDCMQEAAIFDMDGTLCDVRSIRHYVQYKPNHRNFHKFHGESINCPAYPEVKELFLKLQQQGLAMLVVTARTSDYSMLTNLWLREQGLHCDEMYMRERRDQRPDVEVKADLLVEIQRSYQPVLAVDDREHVAAVWRAAGIPVIMVAEDGSLHPDA